MTKQEREYFEKWWSSYGLDFDLSRNLQSWAISRIKETARRSYNRGLIIGKNTPKEKPWGL